MSVKGCHAASAAQIPSAQESSTTNCNPKTKAVYDAIIATQFRGFGSHTLIEVAKLEARVNPQHVLKTLQLAKELSDSYTDPLLAWVRIARVAINQHRVFAIGVLDDLRKKIEDASLEFLILSSWAVELLEAPLLALDIGERICSCLFDSKVMQRDPDAYAKVLTAIAKYKIGSDPHLAFEKLTEALFSARSAVCKSEALLGVVTVLIQLLKASNPTSHIYKSAHALALSTLGEAKDIANEADPRDIIHRARVTAQLDPDYAIRILDQAIAACSSHQDIQIKFLTEMARIALLANRQELAKEKLELAERQTDLLLDRLGHPISQIGALLDLVKAFRHFDLQKAKEKLQAAHALALKQEGRMREAALTDVLPVAAKIDPDLAITEAGLMEEEIHHSEAWRKIAKHALRA